MKWNKTTLQLLQNTFNRQAKTVKKNATWRQLHLDYNIGTPTADGFALSADDLQFIKGLLDKHRPQHSLRRAPADLNRFDAAGLYANEKIATKGIFTDLLIFATPAAPLPTLEGDVHAAFSGVVVSVAPDCVASARISRLIVVENGAMLTDWHKWQAFLPPKWQGALLLYRGHGKNINQAKKLLKQLPASCELAYFPDFDPAGLGICGQYAALRPLSVLIPQNWHNLDGNHPYNQRSLFVDQEKNWQGIVTQARSFPALMTLLMHLQMQQLALTQEHIVHFGELVAMPVVACE